MAENLFDCPYCGEKAVPAPPRRGSRVYVPCGSCGMRPVASFIDQIDGATIVIYKKTTNRLAQGLIPYPVRIRPDQKEKLDEYPNGGEVVRLALDEYFKKR